ncbi:PilZ domain-containing protein [Methylobacterium terricola]|uniref:PilZ domain-containing protein n=1 Tax=Methylobacterium terricola TaxID=2583531 RepID=A0A5C4LP20_9HYPH|nr:PilZ domain-containing protein [Methylobacterium terricola]TNC15169.1 PilZ domain-containing protein [Methylobacterium terricola]
MSGGSTLEALSQSAAPVCGGEDKRGSRRYGTSMPATVVLFNHGRVPCVVRDLSGSGAKIGLSRRYVLSDRLWIIIPHMNITRQASLVWRNGEFAGIAFDKPLG